MNTGIGKEGFAGWGMLDDHPFMGVISFYISYLKC